MPKKGKKMQKIFFKKQKSKCDTCFYTVTKKLMAILVFFTQTELFTALYPTLRIKNFYLLKVKKFHDESVKNERAIGKKLEG